jgi:DNA-binding transcriptional ArsR family regulator|uniref:ArsR family transcriptional regulator n=1 Tax=candidate division WOR-3 bacterium TaxID=2052148 RepID=A0A7C3UZE6_UNCW3
MHIKIMPRMGDIFSALANPVRLKIITLLSRNERCVCEIAVAIKRERSVTSRYLASLAQVGLLKSRRKGKMVLYRLKDKRVLKLLSIGQDMIKNPVKRQREER